MDFVKIVEAYRWTPDSTPKMFYPTIDSDNDDDGGGGHGESMPLLPVSDTSSADFRAIGELSDAIVNAASDLTAHVSLQATSIQDTLKSDDNKQRGGMLERAKARYESSLSSRWYRPELRARGKEKARRKSRGKRSDSLAQGIIIAVDGNHSSRTNIGAGHAMSIVCPLQSACEPGMAEEKRKRSMKAGHLKKTKQKRSNIPLEVEDRARGDVSTASWSSDPPDFSDMSQRRICQSQVNRVPLKRSSSKPRMKRASGLTNGNKEGHVFPTEATSRFFPAAPTLILQTRSERSRKEDCRNVGGADDGIVNDFPSREKTFLKKRRKPGANKIQSKDPSSSNFPAATELESLEGGSFSSVSDISVERVPRRHTSRLDVNALGQREIANKDWIPPVSVHALIQEELYDDPWKVLVACMLLNKTSGSQMQKVIWDVFALCPTPEAAVAIETQKLEEVIRSLGLQKKRACMIQRFSHDYLGKDWKNVTELHGIGKYAVDAYAIFCEGRWREVKPEDHKLVDYWQYLHATDGVGYAFKDDRDKRRHAII